MNKKAFSFIEMIIVISIIILVSVIAATVNTNLKTKTLNTRTTADLETLNNALTSYLQDKNTLPSPAGNINYFKEDTSYSEEPSATNTDVFGVYGQITSDTLPNNYLSFLPLDQFTGAFYAYGKTFNKDEFEVAGIIRESGNVSAMVVGNYSAENGPYNLIREYNGPNFVYDESTKYLPYNPEELSLNARITELATGVTVNGNPATLNQIITQGQEITVPQNQQATLYFGDGSKSVLGDTTSPTTLTLTELSYPEDGNSLISKVSLALSAGTIWTNATQMGQESDFSIQTGDTTAAVRGTIFGVNADEEIQVISGTVEKTIAGGANTDITSANSDSVASINSEIDKGTGELIETLKTEVISYNGDTKIVTLKMNNVFKYNADYLKVNNNTSLHSNTSDWDRDNTGEQEFDISEAQGTQVTLAFCKALGDEEICTRSTSVARELSYLTGAVDGNTCTPDAQIYDGYDFGSLDPFENIKPLTKEDDLGLPGKKIYNIIAQCNNTNIEYGAEEIVYECNAGYDDQNQCSPIACIAQDITKVDRVYSLGAKSHDGIYSETIEVQENNGAYEYTLTAQCELGNIINDTESAPSLIAGSCTNNTIEDNGNCREALACTIQTSAGGNNWYDTNDGKVLHDTAAETIYKNLVDGSSLAKYQASATCNDGTPTFTPQQYIYTEYTDIDPGTQLSSLPQSNTVDLTGDYTIEMNLSGNELHEAAIKYLVDQDAGNGLITIGSGTDIKTIRMNGIIICNSNCNISPQSNYNIKLTFSNGNYNLQIGNSFSENISSTNIFNKNMYIGSRSTGQNPLQSIQDIKYY